ncbi:MAG: glycosyltransferase [Candidatus Sumerlaeota bacterium]
MFKKSATLERTRDFIFVGRLVSDKGADLVLEAAKLMAERSLFPSITIVGGGPEESALKQMAAQGGLRNIEFAGIKRGAELVATLNAHRVLLVPSRWPEPFGIVALEGIACGCAVIASQDGGLPEAVGPCGLLFPNGDATQLAARMISLVENPDLIVKLQGAADSHLQDFTRSAVSSKYLELLRKDAHEH